MPARPVRLRALERARRYIGVTESPPGSNRGTYIDLWLKQAGYRTSGLPWCMAFVHAMYEDEGHYLGGWGSVGHFEAWARKCGYKLPVRPLKGDLVCFRFDQDDWPDHVGFVEKVLALRWRNGRFVGWCATIEGNTSSGDYGSQADGGGVYRRRRWINSRTRFVRVQ